MKRFLSLDERVFNDNSIDKILSTFSDLDGFELAVHESLMEKEKYIELSKKTIRNSKKLSFHAPNFLDGINFEILHINSDLNVKKNYINNFNLISTLTEELDENVIYTFHGATDKFVKTTQQNLKDSTYFFIDFALNYIESKKLNINLAFETINKNNDFAYGISRDEVLNSINDFNSKKLGICLDLVHDYFNNDEKIILLNDDFYQKIFNIHIHGYGENIVENVISHHTPLYKSKIDFKEILNFLKEKNYNKAIVNELMFNKTNNYIKDAIKDIDFF